MKILIDVMNENFATKSDLKELELKLESALKDLEYKLTIKLGTMLGTMLTVAVGVIAMLIKLSH